MAISETKYERDKGASIMEPHSVAQVEGQPDLGITGHDEAKGCDNEIYPWFKFVRPLFED